MINKPWQKITSEDIKRLVDEVVPESHTLDYKEALPNESPKSELDFLIDVVSFANASGGDLVFGIKEKREEGKPTALPETFVRLKMRGTLDETKRRLESLIRSGVSPTLAIKINHFNNLPAGPVVVVRIPGNWAAPHMLTCYGKDFLRSQFYQRHNGGNHPMDIGEIRAAFTVSESRISKIRAFRAERLSEMQSPNETSPSVEGQGARRAVHIVPINVVDPSLSLDISKLENRTWGPSPAFIGSPRWRSSHFNFEGYLIQDFNSSTHKPFGYVQIFRTGAIESLKIISDYEYIDNDFEINTIRQVKDLLKILMDLEVASPVFIMVSLLGVRNYPVILPRNAHYSGHHNRLNRELLTLPECMLEDFATPVEIALRPAFDTLYQSAGMPRSLNYDEHGSWIGEDIAFE